jgi:glycogenin
MWKIHRPRRAPRPAPGGERAFACLVSTPRYLDGALALEHSLRRVRSAYPLWVVTTPSLGAEALAKLDRAGVPHCPLAEDVGPGAEAAARNAAAGYAHWTAAFGKLGLFSMTRWQKIVSLDADMMVVRNIDDLFERPHLSAVAAGRSYPGLGEWRDLNSGLLVIEPRAGLAAELAALIPVMQARIEASRPGGAVGDQDVVNGYAADWPERPDLHLHEGNNVFLEHVDHYLGLFRASGEGDAALRVVHFVGGRKPWDLDLAGLLRACWHHARSGHPRAVPYLLAYAWLIAEARRV